MMKRLVLPLLILCLAFSILAACGNKKSKKEDNVQSIVDQLDELPVELDDDTKELLEKIEDADPANVVPAAESAKIKVTADLPEGWTEVQDHPSMIASYEKETNMIQVMEAWAPSEVKGTKDLVEYEKEQIKEYFEDATFSEIENVTFLGMDAFRMVIDIPIMKTMKQTQVYTYFEKGGNYYKVMGAYFSDDEQGKDEVEAITGSLKIE